MYEHTSLQGMSRLDDGSLVLVTGRLRRHVLGTLLTQAGHSVPLIGEPVSCAPRHGSAVDLWGQLLAGPRPRILVHDARTLGSTKPIGLPTVPQLGAYRLVLRIERHGTQYLGVSGTGQQYLLQWPGREAGVYVVTGYLSNLSPPLLEVSSAVQV